MEITQIQQNNTGGNAPKRRIERVHTSKPSFTPTGTALNTVRRAYSARKRKIALERTRKNDPDMIHQKDVVKKLTGPIFYMMLLLALVKDFFDFILTGSLILSVLILPITLSISVVIFFYLFMNKVKMSSKKTVTMLMTFIIELLPILSLLPMTTVSLLIIRHLENSKGGLKIATKLARLAT